MTVFLHAQNPIEDVGDLKKAANQMFKAARFTEAFPLYAQLLSLDPKNPELNYRFGVCNLYADKRDPEKPLKYLLNASKTPEIEHDVHYFLGQARHFTFRFPDAIRSYEQFKEKAGSRAVKDLDIDRKIEMCKNGMFLLSKISDLFVLEKVEVNRSDFYRSYYKSDIGGVFLIKPENFMSKQDKKVGENSLVFFPDNLNVVCFASYGKEGEYGKDIYFSFRGADRKWSEPNRLDFSVNTPYDEEFPYLMPDGKTLYFSSKGHNSMGGFDIFRSVFDSVTNTWSKAENLDFAINTPYDDILFVPDVSGNYAYFSSDRASNEGKINVYKVRVDLRPRQQLDIDFQRFADNQNEEDPGYNQLIGLIKDLAAMEVNATVSMFDDNNPDQIATTKPENQFNKLAINLDSISKSMNQKVADKIVDKAYMEKTVDTAFALLSKATQSLKNLKQVKADQQKLHKGLAGENNPAIRKAVSDDIDKAIVRKEIKLTQIKKMAGETQQKATGGNQGELTARLNQIKDLLESEDTTSDFNRLIRSEMASASDIKTAEEGLKIVSENSMEIISAVVKPNVIAKENVGEEQDDQPEETSNSGEDGGQASVVPDPDALVVGDSIPPDNTELVEVEKEQSVPVVMIPALAQANQKRISDRVSTIARRIDDLKTNARNETLSRQEKYLSLDNQYRSLEGQNLTAAELESKRKTLYDSMSEAGRDYLVSYMVNQYVENYLNEQLIEVDSLKSDIYRTTDLNVFMDSVSPDNELQEYKKILDRLESRIRLQDNPKPFVDYIDVQLEAINTNEQTMEKYVHEEVLKVRELSEIIDQLNADIGGLKEAKVRKEFQRKSEAYKRELTAKSADLQANYNLFVSNRNLKILLNNLPDLKPLVSKRLNTIALNNPVPVPKSRTISKSMLFGELEEFVNFELGKADTAFALAFVQKELYDVQPANHPKVLRMNQIIGITKPDTSVRSVAYNQMQAFRNQYSYFLQDGKMKPLPSSRDSLNLKISDLSSDFKKQTKQLGKLDSRLESIQKDVSRREYKELTSRQQEQLDAMSDSLIAMRSRAEQKQAVLQSEPAEDKSISYAIELTLFEITAISQKLKYFYDFRTLQLALKDMQNEPERIPRVLIQDANYFAEQADRKALEAKENEELSGRLAGIKEVISLQDSVISRLNQAISKTMIPEKLAVDNNQKSQPETEIKVNEKAEQDKEQDTETVKPIALVEKADQSDVSAEEKKNKIEPVTETAETAETKTPETRPIVTKPSETKPAETKPAKTKPVITKPAETKPAETKAVVTKPVLTKPVLTKPTETKKQTVQETTANSLSSLNPVQKEERKQLEQSILNRTFPVSEGIYYTIQVGVYRTTRSSAQLFNIHPLFEDQLNNSLYRYCSGIYSELNDAVARRDQIRMMGVPDAFVVAYYKGKRIRIDEVAALKAVAKQHTLSQPQLSRIVEESKPVLPVAFRVQLVAYRREFTKEDIQRFEDLVKLPVEKLVNNAGLHILTTIADSDFEKVRLLKQEIVARGIADAFITAYIDGKRASVAEARGMLTP